jgi:hypothetical protein
VDGAFVHRRSRWFRPTAFRHPLYGLMGDWAMFRQILAGKIAF